MTAYCCVRCQCTKKPVIIQQSEIQMQSQEPRIARLLDRLQLSRFQIKQYRNIDDCEYRTPGYPTKPLAKTLQIIYLHTFNLDLLITHLQIELHHTDAFSQFFQIGEIQASSATNRGTFAPAVRSTPFKTCPQNGNLLVPCASITQTLRISLLLKKEFSSYFSESLGLKKQKSKQSCEQNVLKMVYHIVKAVNICGYQLSMNTSASQLVTLLNISQSFKHSKRYAEAAQTDILASLSLISARRFVQAAQLLRKVSKYYVEKYISSKSSMDFSRIDKSWMKEQNREQFQLSGLTRSFASGRVLQGGRYLYKAAKIELLLAETINQPNLLGEKLDAYNRANAFANGNINPNKIDVRVDYEQATYSIGPTIIPFLLKVLSDKSDILKISSLKAIQFFYETLGCTLGSFMPQVIKTLISIYPSSKERQESGLKTEQNLGERSQTSTRIKLILDHINHLLESLLSLIPGMNKKCLKVIFQEIILLSISEQYRNELRLYLLRFGQRIMQICGPDLQITIHYIQYLFKVSDGKYTIKSDVNKHINHNLVYFAQRAIQLLKTKILRNSNKSHALTPICAWIHETLINLCDNETTTAASLNHILDLISVIYSNPKVPNLNPIEPVIYLLNTSLNQPKLPFDKILQAFIVLVKYANRSESGQLGCEIVQRILARAKLSTLSLKELKILEKVVEISREVKTEWLEEFLQCIPHSNFDEIYVVFDLLMLKCVKKLNKPLISMIIHTLFNQYTVKGKAHQQSKELFITNVIHQLSDSLQLLLQICLFENPQPKIDSFYSKKRLANEHCFDSKLYKLHSQLFAEKINLLLLVFTKKDLIADKFGEMFNKQILVKFWHCFRAILLESNNFKIKSKILIFIKQLILLIQLFPNKQLPQATTAKLLFTKTYIQTLKPFIALYKDTKLHYYSILNLALILNPLLKESPTRQHHELYLQFMDQQISTSFAVPPNALDHPQSLTGYEILKLWPSLLSLWNSPWQNVREIVMQVLLHSFKFGVSNMKSNIKSKLIDLLKQLLINCLNSSDHIERLIGIKLLALVLGVGRKYQDKAVLLKEIQYNLRYFKDFLQLVIILQQDWNDEISSCSKLISRLCISKQFRAVLMRRLRRDRKYSTILDNSILSLNLQQEIIQKKPHSFDILSSFQKILKVDDEFNIDQDFQMPDPKPQLLKQLNDFRAQVQNYNFHSVDSTQERDSFVQEEQHYFDPNDERHSEKELSNRSDDEQLQFQDLGIIQLDDEEWGEEQSEVRITQKLPLKKIYKLSPNLGSSSKHHRLRNKRLHHSEFEQDKIIVDELEGKINSPPLPSTNVQEIKSERAERVEEKNKVDSRYEREEDERHNSISEQLITNESKPSKKEKDKKNVKKRKSSTAK